MFDAQPRRHPLQTFQFWFAITLCAGIVLAWRFEMVPFAGSETVSDAVPDFQDEPMPPPPDDDFGDLELSAMAPDQDEERLVDLPDPGSSLAQPAAPLQEESSVPLQDAPAPRATQNIQNVSRESDPDHDRKSILAASAESLTGYRDDDGASEGDSSAPPLRGAVRSSSDRMRPDDASNERSSGTTNPDIDLDDVDRLIANGEDVTAHRRLSTWYWQHPEQRRRFQDRLDLLSRRIYFQPRPHYIEPHRIQFGDRLETVAREYRQSWEYLAKLNRVDPQRIQPGQDLKVLQGPFSVVVDLNRFELTVHAHGYYVTRFPVGIGKEGATPVGTFRVTDKVTDPTYYGEDGIISHDDPANPLGKHWLAINNAEGTLQGYGIHGTIEPSSIGKAISKGCIRLNDRDIADLYDLLTVGSEVIIRR